ncbi:hypothetical protein GCM10012275_51970 [Longimycelium tulufanense]|uniref:Uncharacterized protein n=1 Tax=Longimycelium tulufanense TaxID=907463 RepID=A0A8J3CIS2_9PSEU|nr:hypothetical protein [Longimycelium tulufanense]GGM74866.1 hypothetical protein GCM10012275_51970 [Longimycelium tulufanense]
MRQVGRVPGIIGGVERPQATHFFRAEPTMAFPHGRLLAVRAGRLLVLATDGWVALGRYLPAAAAPLTREQAEQWCHTEEVATAWLDAVPDPTAV